MIKNEMQLEHARERLAQLDADLDDLKQRFSGADYAFWADSFLDERAAVESEMRAYLQLKQTPLAPVVREPFQKPAPLENIE